MPFETEVKRNLLQILAEGPGSILTATEMYSNQLQSTWMAAGVPSVAAGLRLECSWNVLNVPQMKYWCKAELYWIAKIKRMNTVGSCWDFIVHCEATNMKCLGSFTRHATKKEESKGEPRQWMGSKCYTATETDSAAFDYLSESTLAACKLDCIAI